MSRLVKVAFVAAVVMLLSLPSFGQEEVGTGVVLEDSQTTDRWDGEVMGFPSAAPSGEKPSGHDIDEPTGEEPVGVAMDEPRETEQYEIQGPRGEQGPPGPQGSKGDPGERGARGLRGRHGKDGKNVIEKPVAQGPPPVNVFNFTTPPNEPLPAAEIREERKTNMIGWMIVVGLFVALAGAAAITAITLSNGRQVEREHTHQTQAAQLGTALANQTPFVPAPGRQVSIATTVFPTGGGLIRATSDERPVPPPPAAPAPAPAGGVPSWAVQMTGPAWAAYVAAQQVVVHAGQTGANP